MSLLTSAATVKGGRAAARPYHVGFCVFCAFLRPRLFSPFPDRRGALSYALAKLSRSPGNFCQLASRGREARRRSLAWGRDSAVSRNAFLGSGSGCLGRGRRFLGWVRHFLGHGNGFLDQGNLVLAGEVNFLAKNRSGRAGERPASCPPKTVRVRANASAIGWHKS